MNISILIGRLTRDPEEVQGLKNKLCKMCIAVNDNFTNSNGEKQTSYFNVMAWNSVAENCLKYLKKGSQIGVVGKMHTRHWEGEDGKTKYVTEVVANEVEFLASKQPEGERPVQNDTPPINDAQPIDDNDLPF